MIFEMRFFKYIMILAAFVLSSCGTQTVMKSYRTDDTRLEIRMSDLQYLGEVEVEISYRTYLGFIKCIDTVNGEDYDSTNKKIADIGGVRGNLKKACYKVVEKYPEARYYQVVRRSKTSDRMFLGSHVTETALIRAYTIK